jgi:hypothetical protein
MVIYLISGSGQGAGKTTLAENLAGKHCVWSIAGAMRQELKKLYPDYDWFNKSQEYKDKVVCDAYKRGYTIREVLQEYGQEKSSAYPRYWVERLVDRIQHLPTGSYGMLAIDDVRKWEEMVYLKEKFPSCVHFHVKRQKAVQEPLFDNEKLEFAADYVVEWDRT